MPELPEIESFRRLLTERCVSQTVLGVELKETGLGERAGQADDKVVDSSLTAKDLVGRTLAGVRRKGKHLVLEFATTPGGEEDVDLIFHFGMTGMLKIRGDARSDKLKYFSSKVKQQSGEWPPKFTKMSLQFGGGGGEKEEDEDKIDLAFVDPRRLGRCQKVHHLAPPEGEHPSLAELAPDALLALPSGRDFADTVTHSKSKRAIKTILLDQRAVVSGLGNYLVDEVLHDAKVHPNAKQLSHGQLVAVRDSIHAIVTKACECDELGEDYPAHWLFHGRWDGENSSKKKKKASSSGGIQHMKIGGRATFFDPKTQKLAGKEEDDDDEEEEEQEVKPKRAKRS